MSYKGGILVLVTLNIYAACYYFNYLFFQLRERFGYGDRDNLWFAAACGFLYTFCSWIGGHYSQRRGYLNALKVGGGTVAVALGGACFLNTAGGQLAAMLLWTVGICFTWAPLEALASEGKSRADVARGVGIYNVVWAAGAAVAYFTGGQVMQALGPLSLFWLPATLHTAQLGLIFWLARKTRIEPLPWSTPLQPAASEQSSEAPRSSRTRQFLRLAWLANVFSYMAMSTVVPLIPGLAAQQGLTQAQAGFVASVWMFGRLTAFVVLWKWEGWHYHAVWLTGGYLAMIGSFAALLLAGSLSVIVIAQWVFGLAVGLIYYSSLYYSMDAGDEKGAHGGIHEALIGLGIFGGPAVGGAALSLAPGTAHAGVWAVSGTLLAGFVALLVLKRASDGQAAPPQRKS